MECEGVDPGFRESESPVGRAGEIDLVGVREPVIALKVRLEGNIAGTNVFDETEGEWDGERACGS